MRDVFVILEPYNHSYLVAKAVADRGYDVVVLHTLEISRELPYGDPGGVISASCKVNSWADPAAVLVQLDELIGDRSVVGTYSGPEITLVCDAAIREKAGLPHQPVSVVPSFIDKYWVRSTLRDAGLTQLDCYDGDAIAEMECLPSGKSFFFKPRNGGGSAYVKKVTSLGDLHCAIADWERNDSDAPTILQDFVKSGTGAFLEEAASGVLMSVEGITQRGEYISLGLNGRLLLEREPTVEVGSVFPARHPREQEAIAKVAAIHEAIGYYHGPSHVEIMIPDEGEIELIEFNPRFAGADNLKLLNCVYGSPIEDMLIDVGCGNSVSVPTRLKKAAVMNYIFPPVQGEMQSFITPNTEPEFLRVFKKEGDVLDLSVSEFSYLAGFITTGATTADAVSGAEEIRSGIEVNGVKVGSNSLNSVIVSG